MSSDETDDTSFFDSTATFLKTPILSTHVSVLVNTAVSSAWIAMQTNPADDVASSMAAHFTGAKIKEAKKMLWDSLGPDALKIVGSRKRRKDTTIRTGNEAHCKDIITALGKLEAVSALPVITVNALDVHIMPKLCGKKNEGADGGGAVVKDANGANVDEMAEKMETVEKLCLEMKSMVADLARQPNISNKKGQPEKEKQQSTVPKTLSQRERSQSQQPRGQDIPSLPGNAKASYSATAAGGDNNNWSVVGPKKRRAKIIRNHGCNWEI